MRTLALLLSVLFPSLLGAATYPNYFVTNASPFSAVSGVSMYVPTMYATNMVTTNLTVTDYLFIGTAQINYLNALGTVTASNFVGSGSSLTNVGAGNVVSNLNTTFTITAGGTDSFSREVSVDPGWYSASIQAAVTNTPPTWSTVAAQLAVSIDYDTDGDSGSFFQNAVSASTPDILAGVTNTVGVVSSTPMGLFYTSQSGPVNLYVGFLTPPNTGDFVRGNVRFILIKVPTP